MFRIGNMYEDTLGGRWLVKDIVEVGKTTILLVYRRYHLIPRWHIAVVDGKDAATVYTRWDRLTLLGDYPV